MITYPVPAGGPAGTVTAAQVLHLLKSPAQITRRFSEILNARNFIAHAILQERYTMQGGALVFVSDEAVTAGEAPETIAPGGEYPLIALSEDQVKIVAAMKKGFGTEITDEAVTRMLLQPVERALGMLANTLVETFDSIALSALTSAVTAQVTGTAWTSAAAIVTDVEKAKATIVGKRKGFKADTIVLTPLQYASIAAPLLALLPREAGNPIVAGVWPSMLGLTWLTSENLPAGWVPTVLDSNNLGGIAHEELASEEYHQLAAGNGSNVEVARYRLQNDTTRIQVRKCDVPVIRNPDAAVTITNTGV